MATEAVWFSVVYAMICVYILTPPTEFVTAGLTLTHLFGRFIDKEDVKFVEHHIQRTLLTVIVHTFLPLGYFFGFTNLIEDDSLVELWQSKLLWQVGLAVSCLVFTAGIVVAFTWSMADWARHPVTQRLLHYGSPWRIIAMRINTEFSQVDKFISGAGSLTRTVVTNSWIIKATPYNLHLIQQTDAVLELVSSAEHSVSHVSGMGIQYLDILVKSRRPGIPSFTIRVNSMEYNDLKEKLQAPLDNVRNIVIHRSLSDRFTDAFRSHVEQNARYRLPAGMELEPCIGCMQTTANVKLQKLCDEALVGQCQGCLCRPMWCLDCMGRWFASRQDQARPETWLGSRCFCPTCRSVFCMLDVCIVEA
ncbi:E3 ubiquitin-protein ligase TM129 [Dermacentor silvarum]|uniref:E3 ubiquitin-protein ligase TM129 n=1 Tax=Dermacentor silvarum TaxID=543639 RepID=UPI001898A621|nr:E3 ubiquitin-protein ligase TM129 [Dermacentor silvarum]